MSIILLSNPVRASAAALALEFWAAARLETGYSNNDPMSTMKDQSGLYGTARDFTSSGSNRPLYKTNILNSKPSYSFNGSSHYFKCPQFLTSGDKEIMMVMLTPAGIGVSNWGWAKFSGGTSSCHYTFFGTAYCDFGGTNRTNYSPTQATREAGILEHIVAASGSNGWKWYSQGNNLRVQQTQSFNWGSGTTPQHLIGAGSSSANGSTQDTWYNGHIMEIKIWNRTLTNTERNVELAEFNTQYGLTLTNF